MKLKIEYFHLNETPNTPYLLRVRDDEKVNSPSWLFKVASKEGIDDFDKEKIEHLIYQLIRRQNGTDRLRTNQGRNRLGKEAKKVS